MESLTEKLARLAIETDDAAISRGAYESAKKMFLDSLACAIAARKEPGCHEITALAQEAGSKPQATLLSHGERVSLEQAIFANSVLTHALDFDDIHAFTSMHVSSVLFPCCLSMGEHVNASGLDVLTAYILGTEVACTLGKSCVGRRRGHHFLPTSLEGGFGAVAALARLRGLSLSETTHALGLYYTQTAGNRQALADQCLAKRIQPAFAARNALWAIQLAASGITGPHRALEGECGLFRAYYDSAPPPPGEFERDDDAPWQIEYLSVKPYPSCGANHSVVTAALRLASKHDLNLADINRVEINFGAPGQDTLVGKPFTPGANPQVSAQFSAAYCVALALARQRQDLNCFTDEAIRADTEVIAFCKKVVWHAPEVPPPQLATPDHFPDWYGNQHCVRVRFHDGRVIEELQAPVRTRAPESNGWDVVVEKWHACAAYSQILSPDAATEIVDIVARLNSDDNLSALFASLFTNPSDQGRHVGKLEIRQTIG